MPSLPRVKHELATRKRLYSASSKLYARLILEGERGAHLDDMVRRFGGERERVRSHLCVLVTEGLADNIGRCRYRAVIPTASWLA
jgi:hypothetical protein